MRDEAMHVRLVEWAQWRRVGDGSGYPTMSVLHEDWSPPSPGVTPTMKVSTSVSVHVTHRAMASWSGRMRNTILMEGQWFKTKAEAVKEANKVLASALRSARARVEDLESVVFTTEGKSHERVGDRAGEGASNDETGTQGQHEPAF